MKHQYFDGSRFVGTYYRHLGGAIGNYINIPRKYWAIYLDESDNLDLLNDDEIRELARFMLFSEIDSVERKEALIFMTAPSGEEN